MIRPVAAVVAAFAAAPLARAQAADTDTAFAQKCHAILPTADELAFRAVPWQTELRSALAAGNRERQPVLL